MANLFEENCVYQYTHITSNSTNNQCLSNNNHIAIYKFHNYYYYYYYIWPTNTKNTVTEDVYGGNGVLISDHGTMVRWNKTAFCAGEPWRDDVISVPSRRRLAVAEIGLAVRTNPKFAPC